MLLRQSFKLTIHGGGFQRKRYLYAGDAANTFNIILHKAGNRDIFNLGSYDEISNRDLSARLADLVASNSSSGESADLEAWIKTIPGRPYADSGSSLDCEEVRSFKEAVHEVVRKILLLFNMSFLIHLGRRIVYSLLSHNLVDSVVVLTYMSSHPSKGALSNGIILIIRSFSNRLRSSHHLMK